MQMLDTPSLLADLVGWFLNVGGWLVAALATWDAFKSDRRARRSESTADALGNNIEQWAALDLERVDQLRKLKRDHVMAMQRAYSAGFRAGAASKQNQNATG